MHNLLISVVIPVYQNQETIEDLYLQLKNVFQTQALPYEIIFVNDASPDGSESILKKLAKLNPCVSFFNFEKNVGQHRAVLKGLEMSKGSLVVTMDADLQDSPTVIPLLISKLEGEYDAVFAGRRGNYESSFRLFTSKIFKTLLHHLCQVPKDAGMFVVMSRKMVNAVLHIQMPVPFVVAMIGLTGLKTCSIPCLRDKRDRGTSAYSTFSRLRIALTTLWQTARTKSKIFFKRSV